MFEYIFQCYRAAILGKPLLKEMKRVTHAEIGCVIVFVVMLFFAVFLSAKGHIQWGAVLLVICLVNVPLFFRIERWSRMRRRHDDFADYLQGRLMPLTQLLVGKNYDCYNAKSIDWLIVQCDEMLTTSDNRHFRAISLYGIPPCMLALGALLGKLERPELYVAALASVVVVLCMLVYAVAKETFMGAEQRLARQLKADLGYIRTLLLE